MLDYEFTFILTRKSGKNTSLQKGNQMISANDRLHFAVKMNLTKYLRDLSYHQVDNELHLKCPVFSETHPCNVVITIHPPTNRRMDPPNWYPTIKALIDGMTDAKLWDDDNREVIRAMTFICGNKTEDKKYHVSIGIESVADEKQ